MLFELLARTFGLFRTISFQESGAIVESFSGKLIEYPTDEFIDFPHFKKSPLGSKCSFHLKDKIHNLRVLDKDLNGLDRQAFNQKLVALMETRIKVAIQTYREKALSTYLRDSKVEELESALHTVLDAYRASTIEWSDFFDNELLKELDLIIKTFPITIHKEVIRQNYESRQLKERHYFLENVETHPLTEQQALAVIRNNDRNLVLAAAGTGKTSVMVAKTLNLIETRLASQEEVLVLAYNNAAAKELKERLQQRVEKLGLIYERLPEIQTFHALGRTILKETGSDFHISEFAEDDIKLKMWLTEWVVNYLKENPRKLKQLITLSSTPTNPFDIETKEEYEAYIQQEKRTLQGELVKGYQELEIANWLYMNGVPYTYEAPYVSKRRLEEGIDYRPDFHIQDTDIYLEHFGIDRQGNTRKGINKEEYNFDITKKRRLHQECGTKLVETFHYDWVEGNLESRLESLMTENGVELNPMSDEILFEKLKTSGFIDEQVLRYLRCLKAIRVEGLDKEGVFRRIVSSKIALARKYCEFLNELHQSYKDELESQSRIDFDDMILKARELVESGQFSPPWKHILVDEFQDISSARMDLLNALIQKGSEPTLTAVGDDWQSIYRFSGGKLELTTRFENLVGSHSLTKLEKTFRYNNSIADTAGKFVMKNPEQYRKHVVTHTHVNEPHIYLLDSLQKGEDNFSLKACQIVRTIRNNDPDGSIAVLSRYRYLLDETRRELKTNQLLTHVNFWTFHGSKGLEADYCILLGLNQENSAFAGIGFPSVRAEDGLVESLLPALDAYPYSEERRLMYVAMTRAKYKCYLLSDSRRPSEFVEELLGSDYQIKVASDSFQSFEREARKCPSCQTGYLNLLTGEYGPFYRCSNAGCFVKPRVCAKCGHPSIDGLEKSVCLNKSCGHEESLCEKCGRPLKIKLNKQGVQFWGCSGFGIPNDSCDFTKSL